MKPHTPQAHITAQVVALAAVAFMSAPGRAQSFAFQRLAITGGGAGNVSGGTLEMSVSIGQAIVGSTTGGDLELTVGFWSLDLEGAPPSAPRIEAWRSVRAHAGIDRGIRLDPTDGAAVSEPRQVDRGNRRSGIRRLLVRFDQPVRPVDGALDPGDVSVRDHNGRQFAPNAVELLDGGRELGIDFDVGALPNARRYTIELGGRFENESGSPLDGDTNCDIRALIGDVNSARRVDVVDAGIVTAHVGEPLSDGNAGMDINADGEIALADVYLVVLRRGMSAP